MGASLAAASSTAIASSPASSSEIVSPRMRRRIISASLNATRVIHAPNFPLGW